MEDLSKGREVNPVFCEAQHTTSGPAFPTEFRYVTRNIPGPGMDKKLFAEDLLGCNCSGSCNSESCPCLHRYPSPYHPQTSAIRADALTSSLLLPIVECSHSCSCDPTCFNRLVQHGARVRLKVAPSSLKGFGLFTLQDIKPQTFVCEYAGEVVELAEAKRRLEEEKWDTNYLIVLKEHCASGLVLTCVDPRLAGNVGRFANHSCDSNLVMVPVRVGSCVPRLALFACRHICAGEELTFDYSGVTAIKSPETCAILPSVQNSFSTLTNIKETESNCKSCNSLQPDNVHNEEKSKDKNTSLKASGPTSHFDKVPTINGTNNMSDMLLNGLNTNSSQDCTFSEENFCIMSARRKRRLTDQNETVGLKSDRQGNILESEKMSLSNITDEAVCLTKAAREHDRNAVVCALQDGQHAVIDFEFFENHDVNTKSHTCTRKTCYCQSTSCRGYLPFDRSLFN